MTEVVQQNSGDTTVIRSFRANVSEAQLSELRRRINATNYPG